MNRRTFKNTSLCCSLEGSMTKTTRYGSQSQRDISTDPDPHQNVMDPQHWYRTVCILIFKLSCWHSKNNVIAIVCSILVEGKIYSCILYYSNLITSCFLNSSKIGEKHALEREGGLDHLCLSVHRSHVEFNYSC
jgi:hypothetical protein